MINHTPDAFSAEHPLKDGVIADYDVTEAMISASVSYTHLDVYKRQIPARALRAVCKQDPQTKGFPWLSSRPTP